MNTKIRTYSFRLKTASGGEIALYEMARCSLNSVKRLRKAIVKSHAPVYPGCYLTRTRSLAGKSF